MRPDRNAHSITQARTYHGNPHGTVACGRTGHFQNRRTAQEARRIWHHDLIKPIGQGSSQPNTVLRSATSRCTKQGPRRVIRPASDISRTEKKRAIGIDRSGAEQERFQIRNYREDES